MATIDVEYTDTFGGEANYCWVYRYDFEAPETMSDLAIVRKAKALCGLSGIRGRMVDFGDSWAFYPYRMCRVMFINVRY